MQNLPVYSSDLNGNKRYLHQDVLGEYYENKFEGVVQLASRICNMPISLLSLIEFNKQWFKSKVSVDVKESVEEISLYANAIEEIERDLFEIKDISKDVRFANSSLINHEPHIRYCAGTPLFDNKGNRIGTLCVADFKPNHLNEEQIFALKVLSEQVLSVIELNTYNKQLEEQNEALKQETEMNKVLLSIIAHDVRNPLGAIKGVIDFISNNEIAEEDRLRLTQMFGEQLDTTIDLLSNLVDWSKSQMYKELKVTESFDLKSVTESILDQFKLNTVLKNNKLINLVEDDVLLMFDVNVIKFIIRNLVGNAIKFTKNGTISVYAHKENNTTIMLSVSDTGIGMSETQLNNLFEHTKHQSTNGTNNEKGSGLGLMLTKSFVDSFGGTINVKSEVGKGTSIYINIPI